MTKHHPYSEKSTNTILSISVGYLAGVVETYQAMKIVYLETNTMLFEDRLEHQHIFSWMA